MYCHSLKKYYFALATCLWPLVHCYSSDTVVEPQDEQSEDRSTWTVTASDQVAYRALLEEALMIGDLQSLGELLDLDIHVNQQLPKTHKYPLELVMECLLGSLQGDLTLATVHEYQTCIERLLACPYLSICINIELIELLSQLLAYHQEPLIMQIATHPSFDINTHQIMGSWSHRTMIIFCLVSGSELYVNLAKFLLTNCSEQIDINQQHIVSEEPVHLLYLLLPNNEYVTLDATTRQEVLECLLVHPYFSKIVQHLVQDTSFEQTLHQLFQYQQANAHIVLDKEGLALEMAICAGDADKVATLLAQGVHPNKELPRTKSSPMALLLRCIAAIRLDVKTLPRIEGSVEKYEACIKVLLEDPRLIIPIYRISLLAMAVLLDADREELLTEIVDHPGFDINGHYPWTSSNQRPITTAIIICLDCEDPRYHKLATWLLDHCHDQIDINKQDIVYKSNNYGNPFMQYRIHVLEALLVSNHIVPTIYDQFVQMILAYPNLEISDTMLRFALKKDKAVYHLLYDHPSRWKSRLLENVLWGTAYCIFLGMLVWMVRNHAS